MRRSLTTKPTLKRTSRGINGKPKGTAPLKNQALKPGRYRISAGQGAPLETRTVRLQPGQRKTLRFNLTEGTR